MLMYPNFYLFRLWAETSGRRFDAPPPESSIVAKVIMKSSSSLSKALNQTNSNVFHSTAEFKFSIFPSPKLVRKKDEPKSL